MNRTIIDGVPSPVAGRYAVEITVCEQMGWTYTELMATPADMVDEIVVRLNAQSNAERRRRDMDAQRQQAKSKAQTKRR